MRKTVTTLLVLSLAVAPAAAQLSPELNEKIANMSGTEKVDVIILTQGSPSDQAISAIENAGGNVSDRFGIIDGVSASLPVQAVEALSSRSFVREIQPDFKVETVLDDSASYVNATGAWSMNSTGSNIDVAVVDTGISDSRSILDVEEQVDFTGEGTDDLNGHGTHVAGIIASTDDAYRGVSYEADLFDVKVLESDGTGSGSDVINGIEWAVENDAEVISLSLGADIDPCDGTDAISEAVDNAASQGVTVVVAAGNMGPDSQTITAPGCARRALTVGSTDLAGQVSDFSSRGPTADDRVKPDVVAPGESITSTGNNGGFVSKSGTSMATPHVSGTAAILLAENSSLSPAQVKDVVEDSADDLGYDQNTQGAGLLDVYEAYSMVATETQNKTNQTNGTVKQVPEISVVSPENNSESVNDSTSSGVAAELVVDASTEENETINATFYGEGAELETSVDVSGETSYYWSGLEAGTTYTWSAEATDGENSSGTGTLYFTTEVLNQTGGNLSDDNETRNETGNRTDLPPGLQKKETLLPAFSGKLPNEKVVPGNPFYGFKRAMESLKLAVTFSPEKDRELRKKFAQRRLAEAQKLAKQGKRESEENDQGLHEPDGKSRQRWKEER